MTRAHLALLVVAGCFSQPPAPSPSTLPYAEPQHHLFAGGKHACWSPGMSFLYCWGDNTYGQLGAPASPVPVPTPIVADAPADGWADVAVGEYHTCAIANEHLFCFGANDHGQSQGNQPVNEFALPSGPARRVFAGASGACALDDAGALWCWGHLDNQTGDLSSPTQIMPLGVAGPWASISIAQDHACARRADFGDVLCWGDDDQQQLAQADLMARTPQDATGPDGTFAAVAVGPATSCAIDHHGELACWGAGVGTAMGVRGYTVVDPETSGRTWTNLAIDAGHVCGVANGQVHCYGDDDTGDLGRGDFAGHNDAPGPQILANAAEVAVGDGFTCALGSDDSVRCWGANQRGELGNGTVATTPDPTPVPVPMNTGDSVVALAVGYGHSCALVGSTGEVWCWGDNRAGQSGGNAPLELAPHHVGGGIDMLAAGRAHTCGRSGGGLACWGDDTFGQAPQVTTSGVTAVAAGGDATCVVASAVIYCYGNIPGSPQFMPIAGQSAFDVAVGDGFVPWLRTGTSMNELWQWGADCYRNNGSAPGVIVATGTMERVVAAQGAPGSGHACAFSPSTSGGSVGALECWGDNTEHQIDSTATTCRAYATIAPPPSAMWSRAFSTAGAHTCAIDSNGNLYGWGDNSDSSLGPASTQATQNAPTLIGTMPFYAVATGPHHTCAIAGDQKSVLCWGLDQFGEVGNGQSFVPAPPQTAINFQ